MPDIKDVYLAQLDAVIAVYDRYDNGEEYLRTTDNLNHFYTLALAAIERIAGSDSVYGQQASIIMQDRIYGHYHLIGVMRALRDDMAHGFLTDVREIVHGELFSDFLDMADYLEK